MIKFPSSYLFKFFTGIKFFGVIHFGPESELWDIFCSRWRHYELDVKLPLQPGKVVSNQTIQTSQVSLTCRQCKKKPL